jgi:ubiquitin carboxyl-terminal hydrolase 4/11/15
MKGLDMRKHVITLRDEKQPVLYDLYAVSNHFGSLNGGHYTATCLNEATGQWYYFNDGSVSQVDDEK